MLPAAGVPFCAHFPQEYNSTGMVFEQQPQPQSDQPQLLQHNSPKGGVPSCRHNSSAGRPPKSPHRRLQQLASHKGHQVASLLVIAQVLRLLLAVSSHPSGLLTESHLRRQLLKELRAAAVAARLSGHAELTAITLLQHLPPARLEQLRAAAAARKDPRRVHSSSNNHNHSMARAGSPSSSSNSSDSDASMSHSNLRMSGREGLGPAGATPIPAGWPAPQQQPWQPWVSWQLQQQVLCAPAPRNMGAAPAAQLWQAAGSCAVSQVQPAAPAVVDVGCLLETTLVAAAAEAQLLSLSIEQPGNSSLEDDACSPVDIEGIMQEEFEMARLNGVL